MKDEILTENVGDYPRPPRLERFEGSIKILFAGQVIVETQNAWRVLETFHPPTYYIAPSDFAAGVLVPVKGSSMCEWKGQASYFDIMAGGKTAPRAAWCYRKPTQAFQMIADHVSVYAEPMDACVVNGEEVIPQPGNFYGGWVNSWITGPIKGAPGTTHW
ncbi:MAG: DUF427 domain-containing protein [Pseudomonadota bacterium]